MKSNHRKTEIIRGKILYYLKLIYPTAATLALLQGELDIFGYPLPLEELNFQLAYLSEKDLVAIGPKSGQPVSRRASITLVKITARGIDYLDGRLPPDEGVYLEPRP